MKLFQRTLPNNLTIQAVAMPGATSVTTMILAKAGSRHESLENSGMAHFLEHMFFKGAKKYPTPKSVSQAIDSFGGQFNAFTGKEYAGYYVKCGTPFLDTSLDVLSDMLLHSTFPPEEIEKERGVIIEEMAMYQDAPMYQVSWNFERALMGDQPLGRDQIGTKENVLGFTRDDFATFKETYYQPSNMVVVLAGAVEESTLDLVESYFGAMADKETPKWQAFDPEIKGQQIFFTPKETEQYHLSLGFRGIAQNHKDYPALRVLRTILGGNMSSRMFQHIREEKGLCYSIRTYAEGLTDSGMITTQAGVKLADLQAALSGISGEYRLMAEKGIPDSELAMAKRYILGRLDLNLEDTENVAQDFADEWLLYGKVNDYDTWKREVNAVTKEQVEALATSLFDMQNIHLALIGPQIGAEKLQTAVGL